jgi:hypothetical protein
MKNIKVFKLTNSYMSQRSVYKNVIKLKLKFKEKTTNNSSLYLAKNI